MLIGSSSSRPAKLDELLDPRLAAKLDRLDYRTRKLFAGKLQGERRSKKRGQSVEFDDYRDYVPGDDLRFIDWNVYARFDRLFIKLFLEEEDLAVHIVVDASPSMDAGRPSKLLFAGKLAAALAYIALTGNNRVGMSVFGGPVTLTSDESGDAAVASAGIANLPDRRGRHQLPRVLSFMMDALWPEARRTGGTLAPPAQSFSESLRLIAQRRSGKGVLVVISDFLVSAEQGGYEAGLRALAAAGGYETTCVQVLSPGELEPERDVGDGLAGDVRLTDVETGRAAEITITAPLLKKYKERLAAYCADLKAYCVARGMASLQVRSDAEVDALVLDTLRRQGTVG